MKHDRPPWYHKRDNQHAMAQQDRKSEIAEQKKFQRAKRKEIKAKRRRKQESNESTAGDELQSEIDDWFPEIARKIS